jgi:hypothetical protein
MRLCVYKIIRVIIRLLKLALIKFKSFDFGNVLSEVFLLSKRMTCTELQTFSCLEAKPQSRVYHLKIKHALDHVTVHIRYPHSFSDQSR